MGGVAGEREREREREDVHIWSCSTFTGGSAPHADQYVDLLDGGGGGKEGEVCGVREGSEEELWRC